MKTMETTARMHRSLSPHDRAEPSAMKGTYPRPATPADQNNGFRQQVVLLDNLSEKLDQYISLPYFGLGK